MTDERYKLLFPVISTFENEDIKEFAMELIDELPEYIWHVGASSTGKYHPQYSLGEAGLMRHQIAVVRFLNYFLGLEQYSNQFTSRQIDLMRVSGLVHDGRKSGAQTEYEKSKYTKFLHPKIMADVIRSYSGEYLNAEEIEFVANCIESHMGQWNNDPKTGSVLPKPTTEAQRLVHLADYLASRKDLTMDFDNVPTAPEPIDPNNYILTFGKYKGKKLLDVYYEKPDYCDWLAENVTRPEVLTALKAIKKKVEDDAL